MPHDPVRVDEVRAWFAEVEDDLRAARHDLVAEPPLAKDALFHAQQAAEKALKAFLIWHDRPFRRTHDLAEIGAQCVEVDLTLGETARNADELTEFASMLRYPGTLSVPPLAEVIDAITRARGVADAVLARLPASVHP